MPPVVEAEPLSFAEPTRDGAVAEAHVLLERGAGHDSAGAPVLLAKLVKTSRDVAATRARLEKIDRLGSLLGRLTPHEIDVAVCLLAGRLRQGRIGLGGAGVRAARPDRPAPEATLGLVEVDEAFERIASLAGPGSSRERTRLLSVLLSRATREELDFLVRLIAGELRQGALMAIMGEAVARAANVAPSDVRRALMLAGDLPAVARAALTQGSAGLVSQ